MTSVMTTSGTVVTSASTEMTSMPSTVSSSDSTDMYNSSTSSFQTTSVLTTEPSTSNHSRLSSQEAVSFYVPLSLCLGAWSIAAFIIGGNLLIVLALVRVRRLRTLSNLYIASLAVADCLVGILLLPLGISFLPSFTHLFRDSYMGCMTFQGLIYTMAVCSGGHILLVSIDRYLFLIQPFLYGRVMNERKVIASISFIWILSFCYGSGVYVFNIYETVRNCNGPEVLTLVYNAYMSGSLYFLLMLVTAYIYCRIMVLAIQKHNSDKKTKPVQMGTMLETSITSAGSLSKEENAIHEPVVPTAPSEAHHALMEASSVQNAAHSSATTNHESQIPSSSCATQQIGDRVGTKSDDCSVSAHQSTCAVTNSGDNCAAPRASSVDSSNVSAAGAERSQNTTDTTAASTTPAKPPDGSTSDTVPGNSESPPRILTAANAAPGVVSSIQTLGTGVTEADERSGSSSRATQDAFSSLQANHKQSSGTSVDHFPMPTSSGRPPQPGSVAETKRVSKATSDAGKSAKTTAKSSHRYRHSEPSSSYWKAVRLFVCVFGCFAIFWLPYYRCLFIRAVHFVPQSIMDICVILGLLNSGVNFIVYTMISRDFRAFFKRFLCPYCSNPAPA